VPITDPYRWLENQESAQTREWLQAQHEYSRAYFDGIPGRTRIEQRVRELLDVETHDSLQKSGHRYFFRKRMPGQEQPCIFMREHADGTDQILIDPSKRGSGPYTAVRLLRVSPNGQLLLYEIKEGGERTGKFELLDLATRQTLPDALPRGYLRGFAFSPDSKSFYYVHESQNDKRSFSCAAYHHILGGNFDCDREIFVAGQNPRVRLHIVPGTAELGFLVLHFGEHNATDFYLWSMDGERGPESILRGAEYRFAPILLSDGRILAITDRDAPNYRIVEVHERLQREPEFTDLVPETGAVIQNWTIVEGRIFVCYVRELKTEVDIFNLEGSRIGQLPVASSNTIRLQGGVEDSDELLFETESFASPVRTYRYAPARNEINLWEERRVPFQSENFSHIRVWFTAKDSTKIPMFLAGRNDVLENGSQPTIMTSYGGHGVAMTPQFSVFVAFAMEQGCVFALPNIRGGSEFGIKWHHAARRRDRQVAFDDFISAAEWLIGTGLTQPRQLAIFGGSNSGLLVGAAMTQRPELFQAVVCMVPILDMLRYHLFDNAHVWKGEYGTTDDAEDFRALLGYSPYHGVRDGTAYPATMIVSGDLDQNCNGLHARKMTARLQAANVSEHPILLDYSGHRGHSPVLPLSTRINALSDRMAFLSYELQLPVSAEALPCHFSY
jgi:prolyl oligopeptidase